MKSINSTSAEKAILVLPDIRSSQNVGSLFRTADSCGIDFIYIVGITPAPLDQFGRPNKDIAKTALGAEQSIPWKKVSSLSVLITKFKKEGVQTIAIEQAEHSIDYKKVKVRRPVAFILGNEVEGLPKSILDKVDIVAEIPMKGMKESLNVSVAGGIALFRMLGI